MTSDAEFAARTADGVSAGNEPGERAVAGSSFLRRRSGGAVAILNSREMGCANASSV